MNRMLRSEYVKRFNFIPPCRWGDRRAVEIGYAPHEGNSVNLVLNLEWDALFLDGYTAEVVSEAW